MTPAPRRVGPAAFWRAADRRAAEAAREADNLLRSYFHAPAHADLAALRKVVEDRKRDDARW